ncbi:coiled-coil domain-containing protein 191 [Venturia canescens]|uniref:coiled-coil domain-containing protein 191 n=1 Tax=Venturia canescens TaxID=32260 RepID=UPI001C9D3C28|nr:coiled-coil domain-containing protein 191 [Venturia canescens]
MQGTKSVRFEDVESLMEQMMRVAIFRPAEKRDMLRISNNSNDPNVIMDLRHKTIGESLPVSMSKSAVLAEVTRIIMDEETQALYRKRENELLESELKKFEKGLSSSRPRFRSPYPCGKRKFLENIDDYNDLWKMAPRRVKVRVKDISKAPDLRTDEKAIENSCGIETIKVTIKDKSNSGCKRREIEIMKACFETWVDWTREGVRLRELKLKIQENVANRRLKKYFEMWKQKIENSKKLAEKRKENVVMTDERKIELFVNAINEKQKKMAKKSSTLDFISKIQKNPSSDESQKKFGGSRQASAKIHLVQPPTLNRLNAQKKIIEEQRMKLAEQNKIIEELTLNKMEKDARKTGRETIDAAKEALAHCGRKTRRTLVQLMREEGCRDKSLLEPPRIPSPPRFLARMEARAAARRERVKRAEEERKKKLEEQRLKEENARREDEENRKRLQLEAQREAKRIREEAEKRRARDLERTRLANEMADEFYRKYLMRRYIFDPLILLIEQKQKNRKIAVEHYDRNLLRKSIEFWRTETKNLLEVKLELSVTIWRRNLLWYAFKNWLEATRSEGKKAQVAVDFYELQLQDKCLKIWCDRAMESKLRDSENCQLAVLHSENRLKLGCFKKWRKFLDISGDVKESDRTRNLWRELVQRVVPDFDPKQRGVMIDD